ncbi:MAG: Gfo/Idh/MocA family oxidoreductase [Verrucomicrobia bacterium]|nr:Gfo/Idh/MocA family oxidoreductase [Verrucomicrobiota bacterium]
MKQLLFVFLAGLTTATWAADLRIGMIGLDTSHVVAFTKLLNDPSDKNHLAGARVVAAFKGGSPDIESSASRVDGYTKELQEKWGVKIYASIEEMCAQVDAVMIESVDGRPHLDQARPVIKAHKPLFIDKPMAGSLRDAITIFRLAREAGVPEPHHPDLFWYGIHGVESLFTVMGTGCESVKRGTTPEGKIEVTGTWQGGRTGIYREVAKGYGGKAVGDKGEAVVGAYDGYHPLVIEVVKFFQTGVVPVSAEETLEILAFMEAADETKRQGGAEVKILRYHHGRRTR